MDTCGSVLTFEKSKVETMKRVLTIILNGDPMPSLLMHIIRFVMPSKSKVRLLGIICSYACQKLTFALPQPLKKLLYFYYEICPKLDAGGKLKQEVRAFR